VDALAALPDARTVAGRFASNYRGVGDNFVRLSKHRKNAHSAGLLCISRVDRVRCFFQSPPPYFLLDFGKVGVSWFWKKADALATKAARTDAARTRRK
jgi:hypothetical protein